MAIRKHEQETPVPRRDSRFLERHQTWQADVAPPANRSRHVIFTGLSRFGLGGRGKVYVPEYFPAFTRTLAEADVDCSFAYNEDTLEHAFDDRDTAIIHVYNEEKPSPYNTRIRAIEDHATVVFNGQRSALVIANKLRCNQYLTPRGIPMPELVTGPVADGVVFSNLQSGSGKHTRLFSADRPLDSARYNTRFIDTRLTFEGVTYHTMFRIQAVGHQVHLAYPRARDVKERSASVHSKDTPANGPLIEFLHATLITPRRAEIADFAARMGQILGPGFYAHDMVVCNATGRMFMVESGFKFNDTPYADYLAADAARMPSNALFYNGEYAVRGARLFLQEWDAARDRPRLDPSGRDLWDDPAFATLDAMPAETDA